MEADGELERFNPDNQEDTNRPESYKNLARYFDPGRILTVVGTNYRAYDNRIASGLNRLFPIGGEFGSLYNRSDGLVKQANAQLPGAPRTFVHKCHGGVDSLVTSREAYEIASRFFFGDVLVRLRLLRAEVKHGADSIGGSEFFIGVSVKARDIDFDLFHQSKDAENCYGPYRSAALDDADVAFPPLPDRTLWEGWVDRARIPDAGGDLVFRLELYVAERDSFSVRFSDDVILHRQLYVRVAPSKGGTLYDGVGGISWSENPRLATGDVQGNPATPTRDDGLAWELSVDYADFALTFALEFELQDQGRSQRAVDAPDPGR